MKRMVSLIGTALVTGAAYTAGMRLYDRVLDDKIYHLKDKLKKKRELNKKVIKLNKRRKAR